MTVINCDKKIPKYKKMDTVDIQIQDGATKEIFTFFVSPSDAKRAERGKLKV